MPSHLRSRTPEASVQGVPLTCTFVPGAWLAIRIVAVVDTRRMGRGPNGSTFAQ